MINEHLLDEINKEIVKTVNELQKEIARNGLNTTKYWFLEEYYNILQTMKGFYKVLQEEYKNENLG